MIECRECGLQLADGARFCRACGTPVTGEQPAAGGPRPDPDGGYWAAVGRAGAERTGGAGAGPPAGAAPAPAVAAATAVVPPPPAGPVHAQPASPPPPRPPRRTGLVVAVVLGALVVLVLAGLVGYLLTREDPGHDQGSESSSTTAPGTSEPGAGTKLEAAAITASCTAKPSHDAGGNVTTYDAQLVADGNPATAWRCDESGVGQTLTLRFDKPVHLTSVGLIPGIVKTDSVDGTDRFVQNDKIAEVRWRFAGAEARSQTFAPEPRMQTTDVDVTTTEVTVEIVSVFPGENAPNEDGKPQKATGKSPISEVQLSGTS